MSRLKGTVSGAARFEGMGAVLIVWGSRRYYLGVLCYVLHQLSVVDGSVL